MRKSIIIFSVFLLFTSCEEKHYFIEKTDKYNVGDTLGKSMLILSKDRAIDITDWQYEYIFIKK
jgi:hypothetical protein